MNTSNTKDKARVNIREIEYSRSRVGESNDT